MKDALKMKLKINKNEIWMDEIMKVMMCDYKTE